MKLHYLQHVPFEDLGSIENWAKARGASVSCTRLYEGEQLPTQLDMDLLVIMGGPMGVDDEQEYQWLSEEKAFLSKAIAANVKVLGVCLGAQLLAQSLGARVFPGKEKEIGWLPIEAIDTNSNHPIAQILADAGEVFHWHGDTFDIPKNALHLAKSVGCENQAFAVGDHILGFQFHLETTPKSANALIENCGHEITDARFIQPAKEMLKDGNRFKKINKLMEACLDQFVGRTA